MNAYADQQNRIPSIDYFRSLAIIAVILIHTNPFEYAYRDLLSGRSNAPLFGIVGLIINAIYPLAVPFFFVVAGYFLHNKTIRSMHPENVLALYVRRLAIVCLFWAVFHYIFRLFEDIDFILQHGYDTFILDFRYYSTHWIRVLMTGGANHLWFFPALMISVSLVAILSIKKQEHVLLPTAVLLYCMHLISSTYNHSPMGAKVSASLSAIAQGMDNAPIANYLPGPLFVYIGWHLANKTAFEIRQARIAICSGIVISVLEVVHATIRYGIMPSVRLGTVPLVTGIVMMSLALPRLGAACNLTKYGRLTLGIYGIHYPIVIYLQSLSSWIKHPFSDIIHPIVVYILSLATVSLFSKNRFIRSVVS